MTASSHAAGCLRRYRYCVASSCLVVECGRKFHPPASRLTAVCTAAAARHSAWPPRTSLELAGTLRPQGTWTIYLPLRLRAPRALIGSSHRPPANRGLLSASTLYPGTSPPQAVSPPKHHCGITSPSKPAPLLTSPEPFASSTSQLPHPLLCEIPVFSLCKAINSSFSLASYLFSLHCNARRPLLRPNRQPCVCFPSPS